MKNKWWGYLHIDGSIQTKRYFGAKDLIEANESDFVDFIVQPFFATNRKEALDLTRRNIFKYKITS